jgi:hypothetical protein
MPVRAGHLAGGVNAGKGWPHGRRGWKILTTVVTMRRLRLAPARPGGSGNPRPKTHLAPGTA